MTRHYSRRKNASYEQLILWTIVLGVVLGSTGAYTFHAPIQLITEILLTLIMVITLGIFLYAFIQNKRRIERARAIKSELIDRLGGVDFERYIAELLKYRGYKITTTPYSNDFGIDLVAKKDGDIFGIQIKRYTSRLDQKAVREAVAGMAKYKCNRAMVITNSFFTASAKVLADHNRCILIDRDKLAEWILEFQN